MLERLAGALVALDDPFREAVILRYLDGRSAAEIARTLGVPDGTVRWRVKTGLERLRAALDVDAPRPVWQRALLAAPLGALPAGQGKLLLGLGLIMKSKSIAIAAVLLMLLLAGGLAAAEAAGFLPYAPEWQHSSVRLAVRRGVRVRGVTNFLFPAVEYHGVVVDGATEHRDSAHPGETPARGAGAARPVAGAAVRLLGSPGGEQALAGPPTAWVSDARGEFTGAPALARRDRARRTE